ncbi:uncharacterized protein LOC121397258 [Xenopus laevis]|uniref:Uncharacterized protein LOC121397258 n=1 Tax=Xenopus laevis TaxID=8355 RepID=A0A8J1LJC0_XENLA|nr:uncharacterized protein LOC121397258 [Xenopus laevis]
MSRRECRCLRIIRNVFRRKNEVHPLIIDDTKPMNYNVPTPVHLFQVSPVMCPEARIEKDEKEIEKTVIKEETVEEEKIEIEDCESSFSDPIQMTPSSGAILMVVQEAEIEQESTSEIAPAVSLPADCTELLERYARRQMEGKDLTDDSESSTSLVTEYLEESEAATGSDDSLEFLSEPIMIDPSSGAMLIVVQEAKTGTVYDPSLVLVLSVAKLLNYMYI